MPGCVSGLWHKGLQDRESLEVGVSSKSSTHDHE